MDHSDWPYHDLTWWIDQIDQTVVPSCGIPFEEPQDPESYMMTVKQRLESVLSSDNPCLTQRNPDAARLLLFRAKALKKWRLNVPGYTSRNRAEEAKRGFLLRNDLAERYHAGIYTDVMRDLLRYWLPEPANRGSLNGRFGPGACAERRTHPQRYIALDNWCSDEHWPEDPSGLADAQLDTARLCAVPKDWDKDRLITVEPSYSTFEQQRIRRIILESIHSGPLRGTAMDLGYTDGQAIQRGLALHASKTGRRATIDLSDASDGISWAAVQEVFPVWLVDLLYLSRTPRIVHDAFGTLATQDLHIFAGMGNATTFPIETLYFSALMESIRITSFPGSFRIPGVSVFGDDIICSSDVASALLELQPEDIPGVRVNRTKSFLGSSPWRESCGIYAYNGVDVTVPKVDGYTPTWCGAQGITDLCSRLLAQPPFRGLAHRIVELRPNSLENLPYLIEGYPSFSYSGLAYDAVPQTRWHARYQRLEARVRVRSEKNVAFSCCDHAGVYPPARVWLTASLLGELHQDSHGRVNFPLREVERTVWRRVTPSTT